MIKKADKKDEKYIELKVNTNLYTEPDAQGKSKLIKKNIPIRVSVYINDIMGHEEICDNKGKVLKNFCKIHHREIGSVTVNKSYDKLLELKQRDHKPESAPIGFKYNK